MFVLFVYVDYWFETPLPSKAPTSDLQLVKNCIRYRVVDEDVSKSATHACSLHGWYLSPELAPLCLFDPDLPLSTKTLLAEKLLQFVPQVITMPEKRSGAAFGKPIFPDVDFSSEITDFIGKDSAFFFTSLGISVDFLSEPVADWPFIPGYIDGVAKVKSIQVVNDVAERAVKDTSAFLGTAKKEDRFQNTLQVVKKNRQGLCNLRSKKKVDEWCNKS